MKDEVAIGSAAANPRLLYTMAIVVSFLRAVGGLLFCSRQYSKIGTGLGGTAGVSWAVREKHLSTPLMYLFRGMPHGCLPLPVP